MTDTVYDENVERYVEFVDSVLAAEPSLFGEMLAIFVDLLGGRLQGAEVCDIACGEGYLSRHLSQSGASKVIGIDLSAALIDIARQRTDVPNVSYRVEDAQALASLEDAAFDVAVSQMALMDIPDHRAMFHATRRVLKSDGVFVFSLLHPCFEGPYEPPDKPQFLVDQDGTRTACVVHTYATEGHWRSEGAGVRGVLGSYHRMLSTYINDLVASGFRLERLVEPVFNAPGIAAEVPRVLLLFSHAQ